MTSGYDRGDLAEKFIGEWHGDDLALFNYPPAWRRRFEPPNDTTRLLLDFKKAEPRAIRTVLEWAWPTLDAARPRLEEEFHCGVVVVAPKHTADAPNAACEAFAAEIALRMPFLTHQPGALRRVFSTPEQHRGAGLSADDHARTIAWVGRRLAPVPANSRTCHLCTHAPFRTPTGRAWHLEHIHKVASDATPDIRGVLLIDDITTHGQTAEGCRQVIKAALGPRRVPGLFVGKTGGW